MAQTLDAAERGSRANGGEGAGGAGGGGSGDGPGPRRDLQRELVALGDASNRILQEDDFDSICRMFLDAIRKHTPYRSAVLSLFGEDGRDVQTFFTGFADEEIDYFHRHKPTVK